MVNMHFEPEKLSAFKELFENTKAKIRSFPGCLHLELLQDKDDACALSTYSHWESADALESYRHSELFAVTWAATKVLFDKAPKAISYERLRSNYPTSGIHALLQRTARTSNLGSL
jgi:quinol monooxygenase YgiN